MRIQLHFAFLLFVASVTVSCSPTAQPTQTELSATASPIPSQTPTHTPTATPSPTLMPTPMYVSEAAEMGAIEQLERYGYGQFMSSGYSPDGKLIAVATTAGVFLYDAETLLPIRLVISPGAPTAFAFSSDSKKLAIGTSTGAIRVFEQDGTVVADVAAHDWSVISMAFSPDGNTLASVGLGEILNIWSTEDWSKLATNKVRRLGEIMFLPDGEQLVGVAGQRIVMISAQSGQVANSIDSFTYQGKTVWGPQISSLDVSQDGQYLAFAANGSNSYLVIWNIAGRFTHSVDVLELPEGVSGSRIVWLDDISLSKDANKVAFVTRWFSGLYDLETKEIIRFTTDYVYSQVDFSPEKDMVLHGLNRMNRSWRLDGAIELERSKPLPFSLSLPSRTSGPWEVVVEEETGQVTLQFGNQQIYSMRGHTPVKAPLVSYLYSVNTVVFSEDKDFFVTVGFDGQVKLWPTNTDTGPILLGRIYREMLTGGEAAISPDGKLIAFGGLDGQVFVVQIDNDKVIPVPPFKPTGNRISSLAFSRDQKLLAIGDIYGTISLYRVEDGVLLQSLQAQSAVYHLQFAKNDRMLYSVERDLIYFWGAYSQP